MEDTLIIISVGHLNAQRATGTLAGFARTPKRTARAESESVDARRRVLAHNRRGRGGAVAAGAAIGGVAGALVEISGTMGENRTPRTRSPSEVAGSAIGVATTRSTVCRVGEVDRKKHERGSRDSEGNEPTLT